MSYDQKYSALVRAITEYGYSPYNTAGAHAAAAHLVTVHAANAGDAGKFRSKYVSPRHF